MNRTSGILLHISSLPNKYSIGSLGKEAYSFIDFLKKSDVHVWQILPLNITSYGNSPYQSPSSIGLNYYFISLDTLHDKNLLLDEDLSLCLDSSDRVDYSRLFNERINILKKAFSRFDKEDVSFKNFVSSKTYSDVAFYMVLKELNSYKPWYLWDEKIRTYSSKLENEIISNNYDLYLFYLWTQYEFLNQYNALKDYAHKNGILIMGDMPFYLAYDSVECYKYRQYFDFANDHPISVAGCPPDYFSPTGQLWGNPIYNWEYIKSENYKFINDRINYNLKIFDILRIDHFRGFSSYYSIPFGEKTAINGKWIKGPGFDLFKDKLDLNIIAEDLGLIDDDVRKLLKDCNYPGMKVLQFAFDNDVDNPHKPSNSSENYICYTGTHDNQTTLGFIKSLDKQQLKSFKDDVKNECKLLNISYDDRNEIALASTINRIAFNSKCNMAILPIQDVLFIDDQGRMNIPSVMDGNWEFRLKEDDLTDEVSTYLQNLVKFSKRNNKYA